MHINEQSGKQKKRIEDIFRRFPSTRSERKLAIILTTRYCFIFLSRIGLTEIRTKVENNSEETKRRNATSTAFNVYDIQVKRMKKSVKKHTNWKKEEKIEYKVRRKIREDRYTFCSSCLFDCIQECNKLSLYYVSDEMWKIII